MPRKYKKLFKKYYARIINFVKINIYEKVIVSKTYYYLNMNNNYGIFFYYFCLSI